MHVVVDQPAVQTLAEGPEGDPRGEAAEEFRGPATSRTCAGTSFKVSSYSSVAERHQLPPSRRAGPSCGGSILHALRSQTTDWRSRARDP
mmetsp:Transcript_33809/g.60801  ORF Transcript_33809/g.60801 Transcript_33809/m.60801 type:complete len:90 (+) Transcript_33809:478-747(+)